MSQQTNIPYATPMRDEKYVLTLAAAASARLGAEVACIQGPRYTEWRLGNRGFAVGPHPALYPPRGLLEVIIKKLSPPMPVRLKREDNEDDSQANPNTARGIRGKDPQRRKGAVRR